MASETDSFYPETEMFTVPFRFEGSELDDSIQATAIRAHIRTGPDAIKEFLAVHMGIKCDTPDELESRRRIENTQGYYAWEEERQFCCVVTRPDSTKLVYKLNIAVIGEWTSNWHAYEYLVDQSTKAGVVLLKNLFGHLGVGPENVEVYIINRSRRGLMRHILFKTIAILIGKQRKVKELAFVAVQKVVESAQ